MPLRGTLSGVAPSPLVSRSVLPDAPRQLIRTFGAEKGRRFERNKKGPRETGGFFVYLRGYFSFVTI